MTSTRNDQICDPVPTLTHPQKWTIDLLFKAIESSNTWQISRQPPTSLPCGCYKCIVAVSIFRGGGRSKFFRWGTETQVAQMEKLHILVTCQFQSDLNQGGFFSVLYGHQNRPGVRLTASTNGHCKVDTMMTSSSEVSDPMIPRHVWKGKSFGWVRLSSRSRCYVVCHVLCS